MEAILDHPNLEYSNYQFDPQNLAEDKVVKDDLNQYQVAVEAKVESQKENGTAKGSILDIDRYPILYHQILEYYRNDPAEAERVLLSIFEEDIRAILWEATKSPLPFTFYYHRQVQVDGSVKFVHQSDLHWGKGIFEGVSKIFRNGAELEAINNFQTVADQLQIGESALIMSPKWDQSEEIGSVPYTDSQGTFVQRMGEDLYFARQFQREKLDRLGCIDVVNKFVGRRVLPSEASIQEVVTYIGTRSTFASTDYLMEMIAGVTGEPINQVELAKFKKLDEDVRQKSKNKAINLLIALKRGEIREQLEQTLANILIDTAGLENLNASITQDGDRITISTDCISISFGENRRGWTKAGGGESEAVWGFCKSCGGFRKVICNICKSCALKD